MNKNKKQIIENIRKISNCPAEFSDQEVIDQYE